MKADETAMDPWVAVQVRSRMERAVAEHLEYRGYECFLPFVLERRRDRPRSVETPVFPGYVFCRFNETPQGHIVTTPGVTRIVSFGNGPATISNEEIQGIRRAIACGQNVLPVSTRFPPGTSVTIAEGPLRGVTGKVLYNQNRHYLVVEVTLLQRAVAVEIDLNWIRVDVPSEPFH